MSARIDFDSPKQRALTREIEFMGVRPFIFGTAARASEVFQDFVKRLPEEVMFRAAHECRQLQPDVDLPIAATLRVHAKIFDCIGTFQREVRGIATPHLKERGLL